MSLDQYLNSENILKSTKPVDALQLLPEDQDVIKSEVVEITQFDDPDLDEVVELHIYDNSGEILFSDENFTDYTFPGGINLSKAESSATGELLTSELNMDPIKVLYNTIFMKI